MITLNQSLLSIIGYGTQYSLFLLILLQSQHLYSHTDAKAGTSMAAYSKVVGGRIQEK
jgi:hypothetical protein